ncbi:hypothetical protein CMV_004374 [Castanea mollissima]|uniref:RING-type domain-containing protein n=1 Tax=Castanea mollissima TaxID=60419 RepID=A0A8J4RF27_9ROSI|nr:hypothetical protein CMV_004374 [Castanea mollissima]
MKECSPNKKDSELYLFFCSVWTMGLKASKNKKDSEFHTNWDQNFVSIGIRELQDDEVDRTHVNTCGNTSIVRGMAHSYSSLEEVSAALSKEGLKASKLLIGIDFTKSNEWTGPTSYAPVIEAAIDTVEKSGGQYHVLLIISDGQVTRSSDTSDKDLGPQEEETLKSIVNARSYPLSIVLVRVGDGPWEDMKNFGDELHARECHNFKMVNFTEIMSTNATSAEKEITFALAALMEIPFQYKAAVELGILGHVTGRAEQIVPRPPPVSPTYETSSPSVSAALSKEALKASKLLIGIDFTRSNEWTGKVSFNSRSLHSIGDGPNPYEKAISITGTTLAPFVKDNLITCFGFGDGPTSYAPVIEAAIDTVEKSGGQYHVLHIISDGQVTKSNTTSDKDLSPQEEETLQSIVNARSYPLSIVLVRVGDGPWEDMKNFGDELHARKCQNFQMVNLAEIMSTNATFTKKEIAFALAALREIPYQYKAAVENGILGQVTGRAEKIIPRPPPVPQTCETSNPLVCPICLTKAKELAFGCGHLTCRDCLELNICPMCREPITSRQRVYI